MGKQKLTWEEFQQMQAEDGADATPTGEQGQDDSDKTTPPPPRDWEKSYKGLQTYSQRIEREKADLAKQLNTITADLEGRLNSTTVERDTERQQRASLEAEREKLQQQNAKLQRDITLYNKIHNPDNPELAVLTPVLAKGFLNVPADLEGEALDTWLKEYAATIGGQAEGKVKAAVAGASPTQAGGTRVAAGKTTDDLYEELMNMSIHDPNYESTKAAYLQQSAREKGK